MRSVGDSTEVWCSPIWMPNSFISASTMVSMTVSSGPSTSSVSIIGRATSSAIRSGALMAIVFGRTSAKITTSTVITAVA